MLCTIIVVSVERLSLCRAWTCSIRCVEIVGRLFDISCECWLYWLGDSVGPFDYSNFYLCHYDNRKTCKWKLSWHCRDRVSSCNTRLGILILATPRQIGYKNCWSDAPMQQEGWVLPLHTYIMEAVHHEMGIRSSLLIVSRCRDSA